MNRPTKIGIVILMLIVIFAIGLLIPNQFNDKPIVDNTKKNVEQKNSEKEQSK
ncbi:TPA: hypothetical protein OZF17_002769, partial [Staphylococcus aureus]|nr:hypothetical protein [Staphylococcus aureus]HCX2548082.1 hypothetical protein [Staphylococcus aureus]